MKSKNKECACVGSITIPQMASLSLASSLLLSHSPNQLPSVKTADMPLILIDFIGFVRAELMVFLSIMVQRCIKYKNNKILHLQS